MFEVMVNDAIMGFISFNTADYYCNYANKLSLQLLGISMNADDTSPIEDLSQLSINDLFPKINLKKAKEKGFTPLNFNLLLHEGFYQSILVQKKNGTQFVANVGVRKVLLKNEEHLLIMLQDTTIQNKLQKDVIAKQIEIKSAYEELVNQNEKLKQLDIAKDRFVALTTHELRTPAAAMFATADLLKNKLYDTDEELTKFINILHEQGHHLLELINDILDLSKIQARKMEYFIEHLSLTTLLKGEIETSKSFAKQNQVTVNFKIPSNELLSYFDGLRLRQVLRNLLSNAIKYNREKGSVTIWAESRPSWIRVFIQDTGHGINDSEKLKIFNEFETLNKVSQHHNGTGLGLPISKSIIESMGGIIGLKSKPGFGSTFWIDVPTTQILPEKMYRSRTDDLLDLVES